MYVLPLSPTLEPAIRPHIRGTNATLIKAAGIGNVAWQYAVPAKMPEIAASRYGAFEFITDGAKLQTAPVHEAQEPFDSFSEPIAIWIDYFVTVTAAETARPLLRTTSV